MDIKWFQQVRLAFDPSLFLDLTVRKESVSEMARADMQISNTVTVLPLWHNSDLCQNAIDIPL